MWMSSSASLDAKRPSRSSPSTASRPASSASASFGDARDLALVHVGEERERQRSRRYVLAHRELARPMPEALAVEAHQVDRRQVWLALDPTRRQRADRLVAVRPVRKLHDEDEPSAAVAARIGAGQLQALDAGEGLSVAGRDFAPRREHLLEARELGQADRARDLRQAVVEAEPVVIQPVQIARAPLVSLR